MNLLTEHSRRIWLAWKAATSLNWRPGIDSPEWKEKVGSLFKDTPEDQALLARALKVIAEPQTGTIPCLAVDAKGDMSATTTTAGLSWKIPGRVGDSPIIGAGCCVDNEIGAAGSIGKGEENIKISGGHTVVEMMRQGKSPTEACLEALGRIARNYRNDKKKLGTFHIYFFALNKDGVLGAASLWRDGYEKGKRAMYAVHDGTEPRLMECALYFDEPAGGQ
jgi:N4-(beta-N-acetylglucosaminyl)-L-asparaginase